MVKLLEEKFFPAQKNENASEKSDKDKDEGDSDAKAKDDYSVKEEKISKLSKLLTVFIPNQKAVDVGEEKKRETFPSPTSTLLQKKKKCV